MILLIGGMYHEKNNLLETITRYVIQSLTNCWGFITGKSP